MLVDLILECRGAHFWMPVMAVAIGMYLPLTLSAPIALGGLIAAFTKDENGAGRGTLCASGLIAGEAIVGVLLGFVMYMNKDALPIHVSNSDFWSVAGILAIAALLFVADRRSSGKSL